MILTVKDVKQVLVETEIPVASECRASNHRWKRMAFNPIQKAYILTTYNGEREHAFGYDCVHAAVKAYNEFAV